MKKSILILFSCLFYFGNAIGSVDTPLNRVTHVVGGGIVGALESYYEYQDSLKNDEKICVKVYDKEYSFSQSYEGTSSTNTSYNIFPSLTIDEILSVVPRGSELAEKLEILFSEPGGIRIDDVEGINDSEAALNFKESVLLYASDENHDDRTLALLTLGRKSMDLWKQMYDEGDDELKGILEASNFNPCREPRNEGKRVLQDGYRIDLIHGIQGAEKRALGMKENYEKLGYQNCAVLSPEDVIAIDPFLTDFCYEHSYVGNDDKRIWNSDSVALWRPGGCIDTNAFLPRIYEYLRKHMGQYVDADGQVHDCFQLYFGSKVTGVKFEENSDELCISGLQFNDGAFQSESQAGIECRYVFCPGESIGTLKNLGFCEPAYASFAGPSLIITIPLTNEQSEHYKNFSHCMEVHKEGIVLAWQARFFENKIIIGVAGTKSFYGDKQPNKEEAFAKHNNLIQLNMINEIIPDCLSLAFGYDTKGKTLSAEEMATLEESGTARRWVGRRACAYDGFITVGSLYRHNQQVCNARCTTHLGSGGVSFGPASVVMSRSSGQNTDDLFVEKILKYADTRRVAN